MRIMRDYVAYGFGSTHEALEAERALESAGVTYATIPTPSVLGSLCGIALRVDPEKAEEAESAMARAGLSWTGKAQMEDW